MRTITLFDRSANWQYPPRRVPARPAGAASLKTCAFTGHRPEKLPWGRDERGSAALLFKFRLRASIERLIGIGCVNFLSGAARGFDTIAAEIVLSLREAYPWIRLTVVLPCPGQADRWSPEDRARWERLIRESDHVETVSTTYDRGCMFRRNRYLVDHCDVLLAAYDGSGVGGTAMTVAYARQRGVRVRRLALDCEEMGA